MSKSSMPKLRIHGRDFSRIIVVCRYSSIVWNYISKCFSDIILVIKFGIAQTYKISDLNGFAILKF